MRGRHNGKVFINFTGETPFRGKRLSFFSVHIRNGDDFRAALQESPDVILRHLTGADQSDFYFLFHAVLLCILLFPRYIIQQETNKLHHIFT